MEKTNKENKIKKRKKKKTKNLKMAVKDCWKREGLIK